MAREPSLERKKKGRIQATRDATAGLSTWALRPIPRYYCRSYEPIKRLLSTLSGLAQPLSKVEQCLCPICHLCYGT
jgi:hypothetical protein